MSDDIEDEKSDIEFILIDSPVTPFSPVKDIRAWIDKLQKDENRERLEIQQEIEIAREYLKWKEMKGDSK